MNRNEYCIIKLIVRNHPGVMSHITGLFARRAFNLEGIICGTIGDGTTSNIFLLVNNDDFLNQIIKQLRKLYDVLEVEIHPEYNSSVFNDLNKLFI